MAGGGAEGREGLKDRGRGRGGAEGRERGGGGGGSQAAGPAPFPALAPLSLPDLTGQLRTLRRRCPPGRAGRPSPRGHLPRRDRPLSGRPPLPWVPVLSDAQPSAQAVYLAVCASCTGSREILLPPVTVRLWFSNPNQRAPPNDPLHPTVAGQAGATREPRPELLRPELLCPELLRPAG